MNTISIVKQVTIDKGRKSLKVSEFGVKTADLVSSFGDDGSPLKDMVALYSTTSNVGENVILGFINKHQIAQPGEKRIFSLKPNGELSFDIHLKGNGTCEIGGNTDYAVRYSKLEEAFNELKGKFNELVNLFNTHTHAGNGTIPPATSANLSNADITPARIDEVKVS